MLGMSVCLLPLCGAVAKAVGRGLDRATFRVFKIERKLFGIQDLEFLERVFQKLLINFTWVRQCPRPLPYMRSYMLLF